MPAKVNFYLKEPKATGETLLFTFVHITRLQKFKISTGIKLHPDFWNTDKQVVKKGHPQSVNLNNLLKQVKTDYENICFQCEIQGKPITKEHLQLSSKFSGTGQTSTPFFDVYDSFVEAKKVHCGKRSIEKYLLIKKHLQDFSIKKSFTLNFENIDFTFYEKFNDYLLNTVGLFNNTTAKTLTFVKTFLNYAFDKGYHNNLNYKRFKPLRDNSAEIIALSIEELKKVEQLENLPNYLEKTRNNFLILCYTGIRFSDLIKLNGNSIRDGFISITTQKTKDTLKLPIHKKLLAILEKQTVNDIIKIEAVTNQRMNSYLKELGQLAQLNDSSTKVRYKGGETHETPKKKWELLTTHTGRRTFTTLSLYLGMDSEAVKKITGHKSDASFKKYVRYSDQQLKEKIKVWE